MAHLEETKGVLEAEKTRLEQTKSILEGEKARLEHASFTLRRVIADMGDLLVAAEAEEVVEPNPAPTAQNPSSTDQSQNPAVLSDQQSNPFPFLQLPKDSPEAIERKEALAKVTARSQAEAVQWERERVGIQWEENTQLGKRRRL